MWILPSKLRESFLSAQGLEDSNEDLSKQACNFAKSVLWKSKPLSSQTWSQQWKKVFWVKPLFGQTLRHSTHGHFEVWYTESLEDIAANLSQMRANEGARKIQDTFSRIYSMLSTSSGLFGASLKTSPDTSHWDMTKFTEAYQIWATQLKAEYSQRERSVLHQLESGYSYSQLEAMLLEAEMNDLEDGADEFGDGMQHLGSVWSTPRVGGQEGYKTRLARGKDMGLQGQVEFLKDMNRNWPTPNTMDAMAPKTEKALDKEIMETRKGRSQLNNLRDVVVNPLDIMKSWVTPTARDYKGANSVEHIAQQGEDFNANPNHTRQLANQVVQVGLLHWDYPNTSGRDREQLNPAWSIMLMGTTLEKTLFVPLATRWLSKPQS